MKNHIKNYIKIMGLAAVPFGTPQAKNYEIKVTRENKPDADYFRISVGEVGKEPKMADIVWPRDQKHPNPIFEPNGFVRLYSEEVRREKDILVWCGRPEDAKREFGGRWLTDTEMNCVEWVRRWYKNGANHFEKVPCFKELFKSAFPRLSFECSWPRILRALNGGKSGLEFAKDAQIVMEERRANLPKNLFYLRKRCKLPDNCGYVCYEIPMVRASIFLIKNPHCLSKVPKYVLFIVTFISFSTCDSISVSSDVWMEFAFDSGPFGMNQKWAKEYYATKKILDSVVRKNLCEQLFLGKSQYSFSFSDKGAVNMRLLKELERKEAKLKEEEKKKEDKKIEKNEIKNEIKEEPKEPKKARKPQKVKKEEVKKEKKEDEKIEKDPFEPKKEEDKKSNSFTPLPLPMKYMGDGC